MNELLKTATALGVGAAIASGVYFVNQSDDTNSTYGDNNFSATRSYESGDRDCGDFTTHAQAQAFFKSAGPGDPHGLDRDGDGIACESLP